MRDASASTAPEWPAEGDPPGVAPGIAAAPWPEGADPLEQAFRQALARADRERALTLLMEAHGRPLYRFCLALTGDPTLAEEAHQTTFVQAFEGLGSFAGRSSSKSWLFGIARHRCLDALKMARRRQARFPLMAEMPEVAAAEADAPTRLAGRATARALADCLAELSAKVRTALLLRFQQGLAYPEIAVASGERPATLQARVARSLPLLRRCLEGKGQAP